MTKEPKKPEPTTMAWDGKSVLLTLDRMPESVEINTPGLYAYIEVKKFLSDRPRPKKQ